MIQLTRHKQKAEKFLTWTLWPQRPRAIPAQEIDAAVQTPWYAAYSGKKPLNTEGLLKALQATVPLSLTRSENIQAPCAPGPSKRAVPASLPDPLPKSV